VLAISESRYRKAAAFVGVDTAMIKAIVEVESAGKGFVEHGIPVILFEAHKFRRHTGKRFDRSHSHLSKSYPASRKNYARGRTKLIRGRKEWARLEEAYTLSPEAACKSASYGFPQILGSNYRACGFKSAVHMKEEMSKGLSQQLTAFVKFLKADPRLVRAMKKKDFARIARIYNGRDYAKYGYHNKIRKAYARYKAKSIDPIQKPPRESVSLNVMKGGGVGVVGLTVTDVMSNIEESSSYIDMFSGYFSDTGNIALILAVGVIAYLLYRRISQYKSGLL